MSEPTIKESYRDGMFRISINGSEEFEVHPTRWNDREQRRLIVENEVDNESDNEAESKS